MAICSQGDWTTMSPVPDFTSMPWSRECCQRLELVGSKLGSSGEPVANRSLRIEEYLWPKPYEICGQSSFTHCQGG
eukprot:c1042_g1_i1 orf=136-363(+)